MTTKTDIENYEDIFLKVFNVYEDKTQNIPKICAYVFNKFAQEYYNISGVSLDDLKINIDHESNCIEKDCEQFAHQVSFCLRKGYLKVPYESCT